MRESISNLQSSNYNGDVAKWLPIAVQLDGKGLQNPDHGCAFFAHLIPSS